MAPISFGTTVSVSRHDVIIHKNKTGLINYAKNIMNGLDRALKLNLIIVIIM